MDNNKNRQEDNDTTEQGEKGGQSQGQKGQTQDYEDKGQNQNEGLGEFDLGDDEGM